MVVTQPTMFGWKWAIRIMQSSSEKWKAKTYTCYKEQLWTVPILHGIPSSPPPPLTKRHRQAQVGSVVRLANSGSSTHARQQSLGWQWHQSPLTNAYLGLASSSHFVFSHYWKKVQHMRWFPCYILEGSQLARPCSTFAQPIRQKLC